MGTVAAGAAVVVATGADTGLGRDWSPFADDGLWSLSIDMVGLISGIGDHTTLCSRGLLKQVALVLLQLCGMDLRWVGGSLLPRLRSSRGALRLVASASNFDMGLSGMPRRRRAVVRKETVEPPVST